MASGTIVYHERFVENEAGWRYRIHEQDAGILAIEYQEWDEKNKVFIETKASGISGNKGDMTVLAAELAKFVAEMAE